MRVSTDCKRWMRQTNIRKVRSQPAAARLHRVPSFDRLEDRTLPSVAVLGGVLTVVGENGDDRIELTSSATTIEVNFNGTLSSFPLTEVHSFRVKSGRGDDIVQVAANVNLPGLIDGGGGNDALQAGMGSDTLRGGTGADVLEGGGGNDQLDGGKGVDFLSGATGTNTIAGGAGKDTWFVAGSDEADSITMSTVNQTCSSTGLA